MTQLINFMKYEYNEKNVLKMNTMNKLNERSLTCPSLLDWYINILTKAWLRKHFITMKNMNAMNMNTMNINCI